jgi:4,5-DOPA dioxygenase extradiol
MGAPERMPAVFIGHGSPMNALERNRYTEAWAAFGAALPEPRAILAVSAHWFINATAVTAMRAPRTIHDFYGFPPELFALEYPAPGDPDLAARVVALADPVWVGLDLDSWGLDHGTWSVLVHLFPEADIPVVQLALDATKPASYHLDLGARLDPLRDEGVLVVASGNVVHNLPRITMDMGENGFDWAVRFDTEVRRILVDDDPGRLAALDGPDFALAAPTPDHWLPVLYLAGLASASGEKAEVLTQGYVGGSLSMTSVAIGI